MFRNFKLMSALAVLILAKGFQCKADFQEFRALFPLRKTVATSYLTLERYSNKRCVEKCYAESKQGRCTIAAFNTATMSCRLSMDSQQDVVHVPDDSSGVYIFQHDPPVVSQGIADDNFTMFLSNI